MASKWWLPASKEGETLTHSLSTLSPKVSPKMHGFLNSTDPKEKPVGKLHAIPYNFFHITQQLNELPVCSNYVYITEDVLKK